MNSHFGESYAQSVARDQELSALGGQNIADALQSGIDPRQVWHALCDHMGMTAEDRSGPPDLMTPPRQ